MGVHDDTAAGPGTGRTVLGVLASLVASGLVALAWFLVAVAIGVGMDTGDDSEGNAAAGVVGVGLGLVLAPVSALVGWTWLRPGARLRWSTLVVAGFAVAVGLVAGYVAVDGGG